MATVGRLSACPRLAGLFFIFCCAACSDRSSGHPDVVPDPDPSEEADAGPDLDASVGGDARVDVSPTDADVIDTDGESTGADTSTDPTTTVTNPSTATNRDRFGVRRIYPTRLGGREWYLPENAERSSPEWNVEENPVTRVGAGVFHTFGNNGETRLTVSSPRAKDWWRNVEMTGYFRYTRPRDSFNQERHWEFLARSGNHTIGSLRAVDINRGIDAPAGTSTWPGYPYGNSSVNGHCLGSSYHGNVYVAGHVAFEKEISHADGYAGQRGRVDGALRNPLGRWFGFKYVLRNADSARRVHMELWLDVNATGDWKLISQYDDTPGKWFAANVDRDGCNQAPFHYKSDQLITWAGPWIVFRSDSIEVDFKSLSAREISSL